MRSKFIAVRLKEDLLTKVLFLKSNWLLAIVFVIHILALTITEAKATDQHESKGYRFERFFSYYMMDYLEGEQAHTLGLETLGEFDLGRFEVDHRLYLEVADYPLEIEGKPGNPFPKTGEATGINDLLTGFWAFPKSHHSRWEFGGGPVFQFPTASDDSLGTGKWSAGPGFEIAYNKGKLSLGTLGIQLWSFAGDSDRHSVNSLMLKPFFIYKATEKWWLISMPYGISYYWNKPSGEQLLLPVGGGLQHNFHIGDQGLAFSAQIFNYVERPSKYPEWNVRLALEWAL